MNLDQQADRLFRALTEVADETWPNGSALVEEPRHVGDRYGFPDAISVLIRDPTGRRHVDLYPQADRTTWVEFTDGPNSTESEIWGWVASSPDASQDKLEVEFVFKLLRGEYVSERRGLRRRRYIIVNTGARSYWLEYGWPKEDAPS
jgi:hypothetical protein